MNRLGEDGTLYTLFISYAFGGHYCGVYPSVEDATNAIKELLQDLKIDDPVPNVMQHLSNHDDLWTDFSDGTWIHLQEVSPYLIQTIKKRYSL
jgi:hypothetical protein